MPRFLVILLLVPIACSSLRHPVKGHLKVVNNTPHSVHGVLDLSENVIDDHCSPNQKTLTVTAAPRRHNDGDVTIECAGWTNSFLSAHIERDPTERTGWAFVAAVPYPEGKAAPTNVFVKYANEPAPRTVTVSELAYAGGKMDYSPYLTGTVQTEIVSSLSTELHIQLTTGDEAVDIESLGLEGGALVPAERTVLPATFEDYAGAMVANKDDDVDAIVTCEMSGCTFALMPKD